MDTDCDNCGHPEDSHQPEFGCWEPECDCLEYEDPEYGWDDPDDWPDDG